MPSVDGIRGKMEKQIAQGCGHEPIWHSHAMAQVLAALDAAAAERDAARKVSEAAMGALDDALSELEDAHQRIAELGAALRSTVEELERCHRRCHRLLDWDARYQASDVWVERQRIIDAGQLALGIVREEAKPDA